MVSYRATRKSVYADVRMTRAPRARTANPGCPSHSLLQAYALLVTGRSQNSSFTVTIRSRIRRNLSCLHMLLDGLFFFWRGYSTWHILCKFIVTMRHVTVRAE